MCFVGTCPSWMWPVSDLSFQFLSPGKKERTLYSPNGRTTAFPPTLILMWIKIRQRRVRISDQSLGYGVSSIRLSILYSRLHIPILFRHIFCTTPKYCHRERAIADFIEYKDAVVHLTFSRSCSSRYGPVCAIWSLSLVANLVPGIRAVLLMGRS